MIIQHFNSGVTGFPVILMGLIIIILFVYKTIKVCRSQKPDKIGFHGIWLLGLLAFLFRLLEQILRIVSTLDALSKVSESKNINTEVVLKDFSNTINYQFSGLVILILSLIFWGILIGLRNLRSQKLTGEI
jgi:uncharacterized membrane protein